MILYHTFLFLYIEFINFIKNAWLYDKKTRILQIRVVFDMTRLLNTCRFCIKYINVQNYKRIYL
jgi:hypothetical protein